MVNPFGIGRRGHDPSDRLRGWRTLAEAVGKVRSDFEKQTGKTVFLIADERDRASELAFYLPDRRVEGPGHPPVYIPESQDMINQFSFWPRYDEFVPLPANAVRDPNEVYTEEEGVNLFAGRTALYLQLGKKHSLPRSIRGGFGRTELIDTIEVRTGRPLAARSSGLCLLRLPHDAAMREDVSPPAVSVVVPLFNEEENVPILQEELAAALAGIRHEIIFVDDGSTDRTLARLTSGPEIRILRFEKNAGQSAAMYAGANAARGATVVLIDGDLQNDPADIPRLLAEIERGADLVCGYRAQRKDTLVKRLTSWIANFVRSRFTKDGVRDTGCTLKAMRRECVAHARSFQGHAPFYSGSGQRRRLPVGRDSGQSSRAKFGQSKYGLGNRAVRATVDMFGVRWLLSRQLTPLKSDL